MNEQIERAPRLKNLGKRLAGAVSRAMTPRESDAEVSARLEKQFLPAALEVLETPPSPTGRVIVWLILAAALGAFLWSMIAQVDVVAVGEGRVIPRTRLQSVEAAETGVVRALRVREGAFVRRGDPLLDLDPTFANADMQTAKAEYAAALLARARANALLAHADGLPDDFIAPDGAEPAAVLAERAAVSARIATLRERIGAVEQRRAAARATRAAAAAEQDKIIATIPLIEDQYAGRQRLAERGYVSKTQVQQYEERLILLRGDAKVRGAEIARADAEIAQLGRERAQILAEFKAQAAAEKAEAEAIVSTRAEAVRKATQRGSYQTLTAPVDGIVNEIGVTTIGEVVETGARLVTIVPSGEELIVEVLILNKDVGFVARGDRAVIKLQSFPFTRYGHLEGEVEEISADAVADDARGLVFPARIRITGSRLRTDTNSRLQASEAKSNVKEYGSEGKMSSADGRYPPRALKDSLPISPGMAAQVEIITGKRSVISYVLSPIAKATREAGRER